MKKMLAANLQWHYDDTLQVGYAFVDGAQLDAPRFRAALALQAHPDDVAHCHRLRHGGPLSLLLRTVTRELAGLAFDLHPNDVRRIRAPCTGCGGPHGRPTLVGPEGRERRFLSVSHSAGVGAVAVADRRIGIDVQHALTPAQARLLDARLHLKDRRSVRSVDLGEYAALSTRIWARKEAYGKAVGSGLCRSLVSDDMTTWPHLGGATGLDLVAPATYYAALAVTD